MKRLEDLRVDFLGSTLFINTEMFNVLDSLEHTEDVQMFLKILTGVDMVELALEKAKEYSIEEVDKATMHLLDFIGRKVFMLTEEDTPKKDTPVYMDPIQDEQYIYTAIRQCYSLDIDSVDLDYRRYVPMLSHIHNTHYNEIINIRAKPYETGKGMEKYNEQLRAAKKAVALKSTNNNKQQTKKDEDLIAQAFGRR